MSDKLKRWLLISGGTACVCIGAIGVVVPVLPTTPFLLLAAACYTRGSQRLYAALLSNRILGNYLRNYLEGKGMTKRAKAWTLCLLWVGITLAATLATESIVVRMLLSAVLAGVTIHILTVSTASVSAQSPGNLQTIE